jgi:Na+/serine symporter
MSIAIAHMVRKMRPLPHMIQVMKDDAPTSFFGRSSAAQAPRVAPRPATINKAWG